MMKMPDITFLFVDDMESRVFGMTRAVRLINERLAEKLSVRVILDIAMSPVSAMSMLTCSRFDICSLDHDMAAEHYDDLVADRPRGSGTGRDITRWLVENPQLCPRFVNIHSWNPDRGRDMVEDLVSIGGGQVVTRQVFPKLDWLIAALQEMGAVL